MSVNWNTSDSPLASTEPPTSDAGSGKLHLPSLISLIVFYFIILLIGIYASWKKKTLTEKSSEAVMLAGRDIGFVFGVFTVTATWVGGGYINGTAQAIYESGLVWCQAPIGYSLALALGGLFFAKPMHEADYVTVLDPFHIKYGRIMAGLLYIPALAGDVFWSGAILSALGSTLYVITGLSHKVSVIISVAVAVLYTFIGGLYSVAFTDIIQLICIFFGLWLIVPFAMTHEAVTSIAETAYSNNSWLGSLPPSPEVGLWFDYYMLLILGGIPWQVYFQRVLSQRTPKKGQILSYLGCFGCFFLAIPAAILGAVCKSTDWQETELGEDPKPEMALPAVMQYLTPTWVSIIGLGAVSAAVMSSADSAMLSSGSMFARNVYAPIRDSLLSLCKIKPASDVEVLIVMRITVVFVGSLATTLAILYPSVYNLFLLCGDLIYVILFPQLLCVVYIHFTNTYGSLAGFIGAMFFRLAGGDHYLELRPLIIYPLYDEASGQLFPFRTLAMVISLILIIGVSLLARVCFQNFLPPGADIFKCFQEVKDGEEEEVVVNGDTPAFLVNKPDAISGGKVTNDVTITKL